MVLQTFKVIRLIRRGSEEGFGGGVRGTYGSPPDKEGVGTPRHVSCRAVMCLARSSPLIRRG